MSVLIIPLVSLWAVKDTGSNNTFESTSIAPQPALLDADIVAEAKLKDTIANKKAISVDLDINLQMYNFMFNK